MNKSLSRVASQMFGQALCEWQPHFVATGETDRELSEAIIYRCDLDSRRAIWMGLAGFRESGDTFCLRGAWTRVGLSYRAIAKLDRMPSDESSWIVDLRYPGALPPPQPCAGNHDLTLGSVPDSAANLWCDRYCESQKGRQELDAIKAYEARLKRPRTEVEIEKSYRIAKLAALQTWIGLIEVSEPNELTIRGWVKPVVEEAIQVCIEYGEAYLKSKAVAAD